MFEPKNDSQVSGPSRRDLFHILGSAPALAAVTAGTALAQKHQHGQADGRVAGESPGGLQRKVFNDAQWRLVHVLSDLIIPADERSGSATQAGVPEFIDDWLDFRNQEDGNDRFAAQIVGGLAWIDRESLHLFEKSFVDASVEQQKQILDRVAWPDRAKAEDKPWVEFFNKYRDLTVSGFFSSKVGIADLPYLGNRAVTKWVGCDPKVWTVLQTRMRDGYHALTGEVKAWTA